MAIVRKEKTGRIHPVFSLAFFLCALAFPTAAGYPGDYVTPVGADVTDPVPADFVSYGKDVYGEMSLSADRYVPSASSRVIEEFHTEAHVLSGKYIDVSISHQAMTLFEDGREVNQFLVSTGKYGMPTPQGEFTVRKKETNHWSGSYRLWMPYSMNFSGPFYIHELPYWPSGYHEGENHLGRKVSHGCVRLGIGPAAYVFNWAEIGTPIYIHQ